MSARKLLISLAGWASSIPNVVLFGPFNNDQSHNSYINFKKLLRACGAKCTIPLKELVLPTHTKINKYLHKIQNIFSILQTPTYLSTHRNLRF